MLTMHPFFFASIFLIYIYKSREYNYTESQVFFISRRYNKRREGIIILPFFVLVNSLFFKLVKIPDQLVWHETSPSALANTP